MLLSQNSLAQVSMFDRNFFGLFPIINPLPDEIYQFNMYFLMNQEILKKNLNGSIQPSFIKMKQDINLKLGFQSYFKLEIESGEETDSEIKMSLKTPLIQKCGIITGVRNGFFMNNKFKSGKFKFFLKNKLIQNQKSKTSTKISYDDLFSFKYSFDQDHIYMLKTEKKLRKELGFDIKIELNNDFNFRINLITNKNKIKYHSNLNKLIPFVTNDSRISPEMGNMIGYHYNKPHGIQNFLFIEKNALYEDFYTRMALQQRVFFTRNLGYSWGFQFRSTSSLDIILGIFYKNIHIEIPILNIIENSDIIELGGYVIGFSLINYICSKLCLKLYNKIYDKKLKKIYEEDILNLRKKKNKLDKILKSNKQILNKKNSKIRVFVLKSNLVYSFIEDPIWDEDFNNTKFKNENFVFEITETFFFYRFVLGYLPQEKRNLIGYLTPLYFSNETLKIVFLEVKNDVVIHKIYKENQRIIY